jgi:hypothetical protein
MKNILDKFVEKIETHYMFSNFFKLCPLLNNVENYRRGGQATEDNTAHEHCMLDT